MEKLTKEERRYRQDSRQLYYNKLGKFAKGIAKCVECQKDAIGHHYDYRKPLEVIWLCPKHHGIEHSDNPSSPEKIEKMIIKSNKISESIIESPKKYVWHPNVVLTREVQAQLKQEVLDYGYENLRELYFAKLAKPADKELRKFLPELE